MDRLISLEPSNLVVIRVEPGQKCSGQLTLRNVMYTIPVAFRFQPRNKDRYTVKPLTGIVAPLGTVTVEIVYHLPPGSFLPDSFPCSDDSFLLHSVVVPGAAIKGSMSSFDAVPNDWFTTKKKQVFVDSGIKIMFVGSPVLAQLVMDGSMDDVREVLDRSDPAWNPANSPDIELRSRSGSTPLEAAAGCGEELIVELLLAHKASTERSEWSSWGPIHRAAVGGHVEVLRLLFLKGANVDALTKDGNTALHLAVEERRKDCIRLLLANGSKPDVRNTKEGDTPLHIAAGLGDEQIVKLLLQKGANKDIRNKTGKTAYDVAVEYGHVRLFDALKLGDSLCFAARKGEVRSIQRLIENGAAINGRDQHGWTALHRASFKGRIDTVKTLIDKGIDIDLKDEEGYTALHCAVESGHTDTNPWRCNKRWYASIYFASFGTIRKWKIGKRNRNKDSTVEEEKLKDVRGLRGSFDRSLALAVV
ncbi:hypothetical protein ES319_D08G259900v1 [Gossypium barbadense]|uniref:MSP domain-containing protein n=2 Tax=Gossypium TaxID=3633 RepID=A0A5J5QK57_GOSBA|nr:hypothetical protein ES319_D08G259900v1 [Gossypium barbadense]PPD73476.1 hypothetical protein GOBAR_DD29609 [Gossypium barbadense]TYG59058.1 hypothetical protein ES288_D08G272100v1 [Gossypium darwinii]